MAVLVVLSGRPGTGKSTVAQGVAQATGALWLRLDAIEQAMRHSHMITEDLADGGYAAAQAVARGVLAQGYDVIADCVNPIDLSRAGWEAAGQGAKLLRVEILCSDATEHKRRVETRTADIEGLRLPTWDMVQARDYTPYTQAEMRIDTAEQTVEQAVRTIREAMRDA